MKTLKLRARLAISMSLLLLTALGLMGAVLAGQFKSAIQSDVRGTLQAELNTFRGAVLSALDERETLVRQWAEDSIIRGGLVYETYDRSHAQLEGFTRRHPDVLGAVLCTPDGVAVAASSPELLARFQRSTGEARVKSPWFEGARAQGFGVDDRPDQGELFGKSALPLAASVVSPTDGKVLGVLVIGVAWSHLQELAQPTLEWAAARDENSLVLLVGRDREEPIFASQALTPELTAAFRVASEHGAQADTLDVKERLASISAPDPRRPHQATWRFVALIDRDQAYGVVGATQRTIVGFVLVFTLLGAGVATWLAARLAGRIVTLSQTVARIVREGDLRLTVKVEGDDEVAELARAFGQMVTSMRELSLGLQASSQVLTAAVGELEQTNAAQNQLLTRHAAALQETQVTAQEIKQTSLLAAQKAELVVQVAERANAVSQEGEAAITLSLGGMEDIREQTGQIAQRITQLNERTQQIGGITQVVKDLSDQSNMLALNAAIEAVRSGEHGKGFAVVAREIRSLADQSGRATERVREILEDVHGTIRAAAALSDKGTARTEVGLKQIANSGTHLQELAAIVRENSASARQIASAVSQQNAGIAQIFTAVTDLSRLMEETVSRLEITTNATATLKLASGEMERAVQSFKV